MLVLTSIRFYKGHFTSGITIEGNGGSILTAILLFRNRGAIRIAILFIRMDAQFAQHPKKNQALISQVGFVKYRNSMSVLVKCRTRKHAASR